ncbi:helix-turn-helix transcriptional regulator, partial [Dysosmobacter welbionis]
AVGLEHLPAHAGMYEGGHAAVALHQVNVHALGGEGLDVGEKGVAEISVDRRCLSHDLRQIAGGIDIHFVRHISVSS